MWNAAVFLLVALLLNTCSAIKCVVATRPDTYNKYEDCNDGFCFTVHYKNGVLWHRCPEEIPYACQVDMEATINGDQFTCCAKNLCNLSSMTTLSSFVLLISIVLRQF